MKQIILVLGIIIATNLQGQELKKVDYRINFGTTYLIPYKNKIELWPYIDGHPIINYGSKFGYFLEFDIFYNINNKLSINTGLNYNLSKISLNYEVGFTEREGVRSNTYLQIPLLVNYKIFNNLSISTGPYLGYLLRSREKGVAYNDTAAIANIDPNDPFLTSLEPIENYEYNRKEYYNKYDFGLSTQIDYLIRLNKKLSGIIFTRFNYSLVNVRKDNDEFKWKNYNLMMGLGIKF